ncbi:prenyltransferase [Halococcoides cellulosivorans]|uniref:Lycopene elongase n=1 Tax=Halococcoides cellulosivorans TaxID=1679096 RepID=A0A2R4X4K3_9EURY|nr:prenyltransferase [Halococcoides cellulosivorans]AWB28633.1 lycopene elongase [Halococcoides cellulosivorans]
MSAADPTGATARHALRDRIAYLFALSRPRFWLYLAGPVVIGVAAAAESAADLFSPAAIALFAYFLVPANVFLYGVNDVFDADIDAENPKKDADGPEVRYTGDRWVLVAVVLAGLLAVPLAVVVGPTGWAALALFVVLAVEYSAPPLRFKTTPLLDSLSNGLYILPGVLAYLAVAGSLPPWVAIVGGWAWTMAMHTFSAIPDADADRQAGIATTATRLGERGAVAYCGLCWVVAAAAFAVLHPLVGALMAVYPVALLGVVRSHVAIERAYWWFPALNTVVGALLTMAALTHVIDPAVLFEVIA